MIIAKRLLLWPSLLLLLFCASCSRNNSGSTSNLLKSQNVTLNGVTNVATYTYDGQNRLILIQTSLGTLKYNYTPGLVTESDNFVGGADTVIYMLNGQNLAVSDNTPATYAYDNNGYLLLQVNNIYDSIINTYSNGNMMTSTEKNSGQTTVTTYSYLTTPRLLDHGKLFTGKDNANLINTKVVNDGFTTTTYTHTYVIDNLGRVTKDTETSPGQTSVASYTYY